MESIPGNAAENTVEMAAKKDSEYNMNTLLNLVNNTVARLDKTNFNPESFPVNKMLNTIGIYCMKR